MNTSPASILPLTAIAFLFTAKQRFDWFGFEVSLEILEAVRIQKNQRECARLNAELAP